MNYRQRTRVGAVLENTASARRTVPGSLVAVLASCAGAPETDRQYPDEVTGSDRLSTVMDALVAEVDEAPAEGTASNQAIAPLASPMDNIVVFARNYAKGQFGQDAAACTAYPERSTSNDGTPPTFTEFNVGELNATRDLDCNGDGAADLVLNDWRDVLRLLYTGCLPGDGQCANVSGLDRYERCDPNFSAADDDRGSKRACLVRNWANLFETTTPCADSADYCKKGVLRALRRDDTSSTSRLFLEALGVAGNLTARTTVLRSSGVGCKAPGSDNDDSTNENNSTFAFCDGGESETILPADNVYADSGFTCDGVHGDPLKTLCAVEEDVCDVDGSLGVVMAVRTPPATLAYPPRQCSLGKFALPNVASSGQWLASSENVCPDGTKPTGGLCQLPYFDLGGGNKDFNCLNRRDSLPATLPVDPPKDGRVYNFVVRDSAGAVVHNTGATTYPSIATWRANMAGIRMSASSEGTGDYTQSTSDCKVSRTGVEGQGQFRCTQALGSEVMSCVLAQNYSRVPRAALGGKCPATQPADGASCGTGANPVLQLCDYEGTRCRCERAASGAAARWKCNDAPTCFVGFAEREAAALRQYDNCHEPFELSAAPLDAGETWYSTDFSLTEVPLSEGGMWATPTDPYQKPVRSANGIASGTQSGQSGYDDSIAFLAGRFPADQRVTAVIHKNGNSFNYHEVELWLRTYEGPERSTPFGLTRTYGYEVNIAWNGAYLQIGRFKELPALYDSFGDSSFRALDVRDGSVFSAQVVGNTITVWLDGRVVATATDRTSSPYTEGAPGIGFYRQNSGGNIIPESFGFKDFTAGAVVE